MIKKGIILAGGHGTRLSPLTKVLNKQLLPLYDKPIIYYPLSILMLAGIKDILIISNVGERRSFMKLLGNGKDLGIKISYIEQFKPRGLPDAFIVGEEFIGNDDVALILGDNFFYGQGFTNRLNKSLRNNTGATIFTYNVNNPSDYGILELKNKKIKKIVEKPKKPKSNLCVTGLYLYDKQVWDIIDNIKPSNRGELEITDVNNEYVKKNSMTYTEIDGFWSDAGTADSLAHATQLIRNKVLGN